MADHKDLDDATYREAVARAAASGDLARAGGLSLFGRIEEIRGDQEKVEIARLRYRKGGKAPAAREKAASIRAERGKAAADMGEKVKAALLKELERTGREDDPDRPRYDDPKQSDVSGKRKRGGGGTAGKTGRK